MGEPTGNNESGDDRSRPRPFSRPVEKAFLTLIRTANVLWQELGTVLREGDLTSTQYDALCILRGTGKAGLACREVGIRMVTRVPDVTRLLDRLEQRGLVVRQRSSSVRRIVEARITDAGEALLALVDVPVASTVDGLLGHLGDERVARLNEDLERIRSDSTR